MSSVNLNRKRRRVESAASALSKPFKSPLRRPPQVSEPKHKALSKEEKNVPPSPSLKHNNTDSNDAHTPAVSSSSPLSARPSTHTAPTPPSSLASRKRNAQINHLASSKKPIFSDPVILDLQKQERALQSRLAILRSELDTAQQALQLESSTKDADLQSLITKWRSVSQNAAEEVFSGAQERVARMGGMKAWRERIKNNNAQWEQEEMETWYGSAEAEGVDVDEEELEARKAEMLKGRKEGHDAERERKEIEDEEFTMDFMLKTLNIDLKVIGYDKAHQRWIKE
ncbi:DNA repair protein Dds20/Sfr1 [Aspergillus bombycis]|uniref:DNA repair protein Dds20/Sfr1 n=1 Tax=Aspergillus bombycis TaxID=109264 RepID=A0A1F8AE57_9EURO|nr:DNA repair protein Dds20/Sfr1 [Aspergillus bombycis]OGM49994.1 DNA repair protein Dds20/Sfr1 [Aspergillus bombycis]